MIKSMNQALDLILKKEKMGPRKLNTEEMSVFKLVEGIKEKVSFFSIYHRAVEIVDSDLGGRVLLNLVFGDIAGVQKAHVDRLYNFVDLPFPNCLATKELTLYDASSPEKISEMRSFTVTLKKTKLFISNRNENGETDPFECNYSLTKNIGFIGYLTANSLFTKKQMVYFLFLD